MVSFALATLKMKAITPEQTREYYDRHVDVYDRRTAFDLRGGHAYNLSRYYLPFLDREVPRAGRVLELGCGTGFYTRWLVDRGLEVCAMDISPKMIEQARQRCPSGASFFVANCEDPASALDGEARTEGFDAIVGVNTFSYYPDKANALANYRALLKHDGRLVMLDMNGWSLSQQIAYLLDYRGARRFAKNVYQSTPRKLRPMLDAIGFRIERMERFTFVPNEVGPAGTALLAAVDRALAVLPLVGHFAFRLAWVARKTAS